MLLYSRCPLSVTLTITFAVHLRTLNSKSVSYVSEQAGRHSEAPKEDGFEPLNGVGEHIGGWTILKEFTPRVLKKDKQRVYARAIIFYHLVGQLESGTYPIFYSEEIVPEQISLSK